MVRMISYPLLIADQIQRIEEAMKQAGVWSTQTPDWVVQYHVGPIPDIWQWLQFIQLPLRLSGTLQKPQYLAPQVITYLDTEPSHRQILQLIIELDALTSTILKN